MPFEEHRVNFGYGPRERSRDARENRPMDGWRTKGVKSRLNVSTETEDSRNRVIATNLKGSSSSPAAPSASTRTRATVPCARSPFTPPTTRRTRWGYFRYTADGQLISETRSVGIRIYKNGQWASGGGLGQVTHHDRSKSVA